MTTRSSCRIPPVLPLLIGSLVAAAPASLGSPSAQRPQAAGEGGSLSVDVRNLGLALATEDFQLDGEHVVFAVPEGAQGFADLNGDGDVQDKVLAIHDLCTGETTFLPSALPFGANFTYEVDSGTVAFVVDEFSLGFGGTDLNGDGDKSDDVLHVAELTTGLVTNLMLATGGVQDSEYELSGGLLAVRVSEGAQGNADLNGDGDTSDGVPCVVDLSSGSATSLGVATSLGGTFLVSMRDSNGYVAVLVSETADGGVDRNGDGDALDDVLAIFDAGAASFSNLGLDASDLKSDGDLLGFLVSESGQGGGDLNGDGDATDSVVHLHRFSDATTTNVGLAVGTIFGAGSFVVEQDWMTLLACEQDAGQDWNADGDDFDRVMHVVDTTTGSAINLGIATPGTSDAGGAPQAIDRELLAFVASESRDGNRDHNGDGDAFDKSLLIFDRTTGAVTPVGYAVPFSVDVVLGFSHQSLAFLVSEGSQGNADANRDGDHMDNVLHVLHLASGGVSNVGLAVFDNSFSDAFGFRTSSRVLAFEVGEADQGATDLNGDGDAGDAVQFVYDDLLGERFNLGLAGHDSGFINFLFERNRLLVAVDEIRQGSDLNGDGDALDFGVLHAVELFAPGATVEAFGVGLAGTGGVVPALCGPALAASGETLEYRVAQGRGGALGCLIVGLDVNPVPALGGTLQVAAPVFIGTHFLDGDPGLAGAGGATFTEPLDDPVLIGLSYFGQAGYLDPEAPFGVSLTAALRLTVE